jgi:glycosyltransferase involved in cell wall biosynthesis
MPNKILFLKYGSFSLINDSIYKILQTEFKEDEIDIIDVKEIWKKELGYYRYFINIFYFISEYSRDFIAGNKKRNELILWFFGTSYISLQTSKYIRELVKGKDYKFSFQTQTLFNGKLAGIPHFIYTDHTTKTNLLYPDINPRQYIRSDRFIKLAENKIYQDADMIFTCGSLITYSLLNQYNIPKEKVLTAFAGTNVKGHYVQNDNKYASKNILFVGVEWERKGGPILLKVFEKVLQKHKDASLTIVGCSPENVSLPNCTVVGKISPDKLAKYYNEAAIFCLPTLREPFGIVFVEAMHYKLPIVANNIGSIPDMVINDFNGFLIDNDIEGYATVLCELFDDPKKCKEFGENGFKYAQSKFTWELVGQTIKEQIIKYV